MFLIRPLPTQIQFASLNRVKCSSRISIQRPAPRIQFSCTFAQQSRFDPIEECLNGAYESFGKFHSHNRSARAGVTMFLLSRFSKFFLVVALLLTVRLFLPFFLFLQLIYSFFFDLKLIASLFLLHPPMRIYVDPWTGNAFGDAPGVLDRMTGGEKMDVDLEAVLGGVIMPPMLGNETAK
jgi:hypothetical protein